VLGQSGTCWKTGLRFMSEGVIFLFSITYLGCSISYEFSNDVESKLTKFLQLIGTIKRIIFRKLRTKTILKIYNTLVLPTFLYGSENWTLTASQRRRILVAEMKLSRPLAGYTLYDHKTNDYIRRELQITGILDKIDEYRRNWFQHLQRMPQNRIPLTSYYYGPQGRRTIGRPKKRTLERAVVTLKTERIKRSNP